MAVRLPRPTPNLVKGEWDERKRRDLVEFLRSMFGSISGIGATPPEPETIQAGVSADVGGSLAVANASHVHPVETAAPSVNVALGGVPDEGSGSALMRSDARLVLDDGGASVGDVLEWDGSAWVPTSGGGGGSAWTELEVDFGSTPVYDASFTITDAAITSSAMKVVVVPCGKAASGRTPDDWQWDGAILAADPGTGSATCYVTFHPGPIVGKRMVQYQVA